jgi:hypothetical protein
MENVRTVLRANSASIGNPVWIKNQTVRVAALGAELPSPRSGPANELICWYRRWYFCESPSRIVS